MIRTSGARSRVPSLSLAALAVAVSALLVACGGGGSGGGSSDGSFSAPTTSSNLPSASTPDAPPPAQPTTPVARTLAPGAELAPTLDAPQPGSTALTGDDRQGIYVDRTRVALISPAGRLMYKESGRWVFGWLDGSGANWSFRNPTISLSIVPNSDLQFATGSGVFIPKKSMGGRYSIDGGGEDTWGPLGYSASNALAVQQKDMSGTWSTSSSGYDMSIDVDADGNVKGSTTGILSGVCNLSGTLLQTEPTTSRNMFDLKLTATNAATKTGDRACTFDQSAEYDGLAAVFMNAVSAYPEEGAYRTLIFHAGSVNGGFLTNNLRKR